MERLKKKKMDSKEEIKRDSLWKQFISSRGWGNKGIASFAVEVRKNSVRKKKQVNIKKHKIVFRIR